jgi:uncharacterized protein YukE
MIRFQDVRFGAIALIAAMLMGCSSDRRAPESTKAVESMRDVYNSLGTAKGQVDKVTVLLDQFSHTNDLKGTLNEYTTALSDLKESAARARERGEDMRSRREAYLAKWQSEAASIEDPAIKQSLETRRATVAAQFDSIRRAADDVKAAYQPFIQDNDQIQKALAIDLTPAGVQGIQPAMSRAKSDGNRLGQKLDALGHELDKVMTTMTPTGKGAQ